MWICWNCNISVPSCTVPKSIPTVPFSHLPYSPPGPNPSPQWSSCATADCRSSWRRCNRYRIPSVYRTPTVPFTAILSISGNIKKNNPNISYPSSNRTPYRTFHRNPPSIDLCLSCIGRGCRWCWRTGRRCGREGRCRTRAWLQNWTFMRWFISVSRLFQVVNELDVADFIQHSMEKKHQNRSGLIRSWDIETSSPKKTRRSDRWQFWLSF